MPHRSTLAVTLASLVLLFADPAGAALQDAALDQGVVTMTAWRGQQVERQGSGFVVQSDRFNGYVVTSAALVDRAVTVTVRMPGTNAELVAQQVSDGTSADDAALVLFKVNGLFSVPLTFSRGEYIPGNAVWSVQRFPGEGDYLVSSQGRLARVEQRGDRVAILYHNATVGDQSASIVVNECGHVLGLNLPSAPSVRTPGTDYLNRALGVEGLADFVGRQNVRLSFADSGCISAVTEAREEAAKASEQAMVATRNAEQARLAARELERQLSASNERNEGLIEEARVARERAEAAMQAAEEARANAEETRFELERKTAAIRAETNALMQFLERDRKAAEDRYRQALADQQLAAESRERLWLSLGLVVLLVTAGAVVMLFRRGPRAATPPLGEEVPGSADEAAAPAAAKTDIHREDLVEYVLDGRDEDGIRYLLRISGDQLKNGEGVIIGRNPDASPYIINHVDVSRKHARMRVMKNRVFIEDLGSTNGTSVNGQSIEDRGPVSVDNGDQIIIGSVVMKLRVLGA